VVSERGREEIPKNRITQTPARKTKELSKEIE
jgi:hypothetical protein